MNISLIYFLVFDVIHNYFPNNCFALSFSKRNLLLTHCKNIHKLSKFFKTKASKSFVKFVHYFKAYTLKPSYYNEFN